MENPIKMGWFGGKTHYFRKHPYIHNEMGEFFIKPDFGAYFGVILQHFTKLDRSCWKDFHTKEKYDRQIGSFPQVRVKINHIWNHHPVIYPFVLQLQYPEIGSVLYPFVLQIPC